MLFLPSLTTYTYDEHSPCLQIEICPSVEYITRILVSNFEECIIQIPQEGLCKSMHYLAKIKERPLPWGIF